METGRGFEISRFVVEAKEGEAPGGPVEDFHRVLLFGDSGTGKTVAACRAAADVDLDLEQVIEEKARPVGDPGVFGLFLERNGLAAARMINPAMGFAYADPFDSEGRPDPVKALQVAQSVIRAAASGYLQDQGFRVLVVDGLTEYQRLMKDAIAAQNRADVEEDGKKVVREWFDRDDWSWLNEQSRRMLNTVRALPIDTVCTALSESFEPKSGDGERVGPKFEGRSIPGEAMQFFNAVGRMDRVMVVDGENREQISFRAQFSGAGRYLIKSCGPLAGWQRPSAPAWLDVLSGRLPPSATRIRGAVVGGGRQAVAAAPTTEGRRTRTVRAS